MIHNIRLRERSDKLPSVDKYRELLTIAQELFSIDRDTARMRYGMYTEGDWYELLKPYQLHPTSK